MKFSLSSFLLSSFTLVALVAAIPLADNQDGNGGHTFSPLCGGEGFKKNTNGEPCSVNADCCSNVCTAKQCVGS
ncbi:hypothetical protein ACJBU6_05609 [Exserohilum turcicum]